MVIASLIICGSGSLPREEEEELNHSHERAIQSAGSSPRKPSSSSSRRHKNNPYANRGLDKFSTLLSEIEEKKQVIYSKNNPDEICLVQFDYSKGNNCKPVVIKVKPSNKEEKKKKKNHHHKSDTHKQSHDLDGAAATSTAARADHHDKSEELDHAPVPIQADNRKSLLGRRLKLQKVRKPSCYLPAVLILILIFLALFGRSVAILCTSIVWYAIPTIAKRNSNSTRSSKNKGGLVGHQGIN